MRKKPTDREQIDGKAWSEKWTLDLLHSKFSDEFKAICKLAPLKDNEALIEAHQLELADIVLRYSNRFSKKDHLAHIEQCIRSADAAAQGLKTFLDDLVQLRDPDQMKLVMKAANIIDPSIFPEEIFNVTSSYVLIIALGTIIRAMKALSPAIRIGTGVAEKKGRGRPSSPYLQAALELIFLWERILLDAMPEPSPPYYGKRGRVVPVAKKQLGLGKLKNNKQELEATQVSTESCRLAFHMINPEIKSREVRTAINSARKERSWLLVEGLEDARSRHGSDPLKHFIRDIATGKKSIQKTHLFSLPYFLRHY